MFQLVNIYHVCGRRNEENKDCVENLPLKQGRGGTPQQPDQLLGWCHSRINTCQGGHSCHVPPYILP